MCLRKKFVFIKKSITKKTFFLLQMNELLAFYEFYVGILRINAYRSEQIIRKWARKWARKRKRHKYRFSIGIKNILNVWKIVSHAIVVVHSTRQHSTRQCALNATAFGQMNIPLLYLVMHLVCTQRDSVHSTRQVLGKLKCRVECTTTVTVRSMIYVCWY